MRRCYGQVSRVQYLIVPYPQSLFFLAVDTDKTYKYQLTVSTVIKFVLS